MWKTSYSNTVCIRCALRQSISPSAATRSFPLRTTGSTPPRKRNARSAIYTSTRSFCSSPRTRNEPHNRSADPDARLDESELNNPSPAQAAYGFITREALVARVRNDFRDMLPEGLLNEEELAIYVRMYGQPRFLTPQELEAQAAPEDEILQRESAEGHWENIGAEQEGFEVEEDDVNDDFAEEEEHDGIDSDHDGDMPADLVTWPAEEKYARAHPFTTMGRFGTSPSTIQFPPSSFVDPITQLLSPIPKSRLASAAERAFGGPGLPYSPSTPRTSRTMQQKPIALSAAQTKMSDLEADSYTAAVWPLTYASVTSALVEVRKRLGTEWLRQVMAKEGGGLVLDAGGGAGVLAWRDVVRAEWEAMREEDGEEDKQHLENGEKPSPPLGKATVLTASDTLRYRASRILENTTFIPRLPDYVPDANAESFEEPRTQPRKRYDVIIAPHVLWPVKEDHRRRDLVNSLWSLLNPDGGILIILEKGVPRGFEVVAGARAHLLKRCIASPRQEENTTDLYDDVGPEEKVEKKSKKKSKGKAKDEHEEPEESAAAPIPQPPSPTFTKETGMIVAPCTNHSSCPLYKSPGVSHGRKDWCYFTQRYIRPPFLQHLLGAKSRNHDDVEFSYLAVMKGRDLRQEGVVTQGEEATVKAFDGFGEKPKRKMRTGERNDEEDDDLVARARPEAEANAKVDHDSDLNVHAQVTPPNGPHALALPRTILTPLKRKGHILMDVCTPSGTFERWLVSRKSGKQAYRDARKARWGDLWALGAFSREPRRLKLGTPGLNKGRISRRKKERETRRMEQEMMGED